MMTHIQKSTIHPSHSPAHLPVEIPHFGKNRFRITVNRFLQATRQTQQVVMAVAVEALQFFLAKVIRAISRLGKMFQQHYRKAFQARFLRRFIAHKSVSYRASQFTEMEALFLTPAPIRVEDATSLQARKSRQDNRFCSY